MSPVNVKLPELQLIRLDAGIARGRAANRSDAMRLALEHLLREWESAAWADAWAHVIPDKIDEFADLQAASSGAWDELDGEQ